MRLSQGVLRWRGEAVGSAGSTHGPDNEVQILYAASKTKMSDRLKNLIEALTVLAIGLYAAFKLWEVS
jgi:hypothetical protein